MRELSTATDQVSVGARFGSSGNPGCPARLLSERCAIYLQPHHILLGYDSDRFARCDSACREPLSSGSPQTPKPSLLQWFHIGCLKFAAKRNIVPKENAVPKQAHQEKPVPLCWRGTILRFNVYWMCRTCIPKKAPCGLSFHRLGPFHLARANNSPPTCSHRNQGQETQAFCHPALPKKATGEPEQKFPSRMCRACNSLCVPFSGTGFWTPQFCPNMG